MCLMKYETGFDDVKIKSRWQTMLLYLYFLSLIDDWYVPQCDPPRPHKIMSLESILAKGMLGIGLESAIPVSMTN